MEKEKGLDSFLKALLGQLQHIVMLPPSVARYLGLGEEVERVTLNGRIWAGR